MAWNKMSRFQKEALIWITAIVIAVLVSAIDFGKLFVPAAIVTIIFLVIVNFGFLVTGPNAAEQEKQWRAKHALPKPPDKL